MKDEISPDSKIHGANMGPIWGGQDPGGPHVHPMNFVIWVAGKIDPMFRNCIMKIIISNF